MGRPILRRLQSVGDLAKSIAASGGIDKRDEPGILLLSLLKSGGRLMTPDKPRVNIEVKRTHHLGITISPPEGVFKAQKSRLLGNP